MGCKALAGKAAGACYIAFLFWVETFLSEKRCKNSIDCGGSSS